MAEEEAAIMELEFHHLDLRYEALRRSSPERERRLIASLVDIGQQSPIVVVKAEEAQQYVVVDGYKRIRGLKRLKKDKAWPRDAARHLTAPGENSGAVKIQTASLVLCYSREHFFQHYPTFNRFYCTLFLTDGLCHLGGSGEVCMIDNTHMVVLKGSGKDMVPVPEMKAFADRYGFVFEAHEKGDVGLSARLLGLMRDYPRQSFVQAVSVEYHTRPRPENEELT